MTRGRVVHVVRSDGYAGVERYVVQVANELAARGWAVQVLGGADRVRRELHDEVRHEPASTTAAALAALLRSRPIDLVHAHMTAAEAAAVAVAPLLRARVVSTRHFAAPRGSGVAGRAVGTLVGARLDLQLSISRFVAGALREPSTVLHNGVPPSEGEAGGSRTVLVLQRLRPEKQTAVALRAWAASGARLSGWRLVVAGRGSEQQALEALARELDVTDTVRFLGFQDDVPALLAEADVLLASAPGEPFGLSVVEAMAAGLTVVASSGGAHPETVADAGVLVPPGDVEGFARALDLVTADADLRRRLGGAARARQRRLFDLHGHVDALERHYDAVLARGA